MKSDTRQSPGSGTVGEPQIPRRTSRLFTTADAHWASGVRRCRRLAAVASAKLRATPNATQTKPSVSDWTPKYSTARSQKPSRTGNARWRKPETSSTDACAKSERKGEGAGDETIARLRRLGDPREGVATLLLAVEDVAVRRGAVEDATVHRTATLRLEDAGGVSLVLPRSNETRRPRGPEEDDVLLETPVAIRPRGAEVDAAGLPRTDAARPYLPNAAKAATRPSHAGEVAADDDDAPKARPIPRAAIAVIAARGVAGAAVVPRTAATRRREDAEDAVPRKAAVATQPAGGAGADVILKATTTVHRAIGPGMGRTRVLDTGRCGSERSETTSRPTGKTSAASTTPR